jgi:hypothetical protein
MGCGRFCFGVFGWRGRHRALVLFCICESRNLLKMCGLRSNSSEHVISNRKKLPHISERVLDCLRECWVRGPCAEWGARGGA